MAGRMYLGNEMVTPAIVSGGVDSVNGQTGEVVLTASDVNALPDTTKYAKTLGLSMNSTTFVLSWQLYDQNGDPIGQVQTVDLPLESVVVNATYDSTNKKIVLTLENGNTIDVPVGDLVEGLQSEITITNMLSSDLVDDTNKTHKFVTTEEKTTWNNKQNAISDLATIRSGAAKGATAVQPSAIANMQTTTNLVTSVSSSSTDTQYPSAKAVYDFASGSTGGVGFIDFDNGISLVTGAAYTTPTDGWVISQGSVRLNTNVGKLIIGGGSVGWVPLKKGTTIYVSGVPATFYSFL